jgi:hypothetical protein
MSATFQGVVRAVLLRRLKTQVYASAWSLQMGLSDADGGRAASSGGRISHDLNVYSSTKERSRLFDVG